MLQLLLYKEDFVAKHHLVHLARVLAEEERPAHARQPEWYLKHTDYLLWHALLSHLQRHDGLSCQTNLKTRHQIKSSRFKYKREREREKKLYSWREMKQSKLLNRSQLEKSPNYMVWFYKCISLFLTLFCFDQSELRLFRSEEYHDGRKCEKKSEKVHEHCRKNSSWSIKNMRWIVNATNFQGLKSREIVQQNQTRVWCVCSRS